MFFRQRGRPGIGSCRTRGLSSELHTHLGDRKPNGETVSEIRVSEMSCPHAFPCRAVGFLRQFVGKGPVSLAKLDRTTETVAKATGSSELTTQAVRRAILAFESYSKARPPQ